jgi:hypothetical protein
MTAAHHDLGKRIVRAARLAAQLHLRLSDGMEFGRHALRGQVKEDRPSAAIAAEAEGQPFVFSSRATPWTLAGENSAGSF